MTRRGPARYLGHADAIAFLPFDQWPEEDRIKYNRMLAVEEKRSLNWHIITNNRSLPWNYEEQLAWAKENVRYGGYAMSDYRCAFESEQDASLFVFEWL